MGGVSVKMVGSMAGKKTVARKRNPKTVKAATKSAPVKRVRAQNPVKTQLFAVKVWVNASKMGWFVFEILNGVDTRPIGFIKAKGTGDAQLRAVYGDMPVVGLFSVSAKQFDDAVSAGPEWLKLGRYKG